MTGLRLLLASVILLFVFSSSLFGQVSNVSARIDTQNPNVVNITYDLQGQAGERFRIQIYSSSDNFQGPLQQVTGDVGENQPVGRGKSIVWRAREELGFFTGDISFEIRSTLTYSPMKITSPTATSSFKPGASMPIRWDGGAVNSTLQLELYKSNSLSRSIGTTQNNKQYNWTVPSDLSKGADYSVRMFDTSDPSNTRTSSPGFTIKGAGGGGGKIALIGLGVAAVGVGVAVLAGGGDDTTPPTTGGPTTPTSDPLPEPPDPSGGIIKKLGRALVSISFGF